MIERVADRRLLIRPDRRVATVSSERPASLLTVQTEDGPQLLLSAGRVFLRVEISGGAEVLFRHITLVEDLKVAFSIPDKHDSVVPDSDKRRAAVKAWKDAHDYLDGDWVIASREAISREDKRLAQEFLEGLEDINIDRTKVTKVEITTGVSRQPAGVGSLLPASR